LLRPGALLTHFIVTQIGHHGYLAVFVLMLLESSCIPIPSEAIMLFGGALAGGLTVAGVHVHLNVVLVALCGVAGDLCGAAVSYTVGRVGGRPLVERWGRYVLLRTRDLDRAEDFFNRRGDVAVLVGRMLPVIRSFVSLPAGIAEMPPPRFFFFTFLGSVPWVFALAFAGDAVASNWHHVEKYFTVVTVVVVVIVVAVIARWVLKRLRERQEVDTRRHVRR
jgi:membrane protein DedA with SNARE-associated domain